MPAEAEHAAAAKRNKDLADALLNMGQPEWAAVLVFYSALHQVETFLARKGIHPTDHRDRRNYINQLKELSPIYVDYRRLYTRSMWARYDLSQFTKAQVEKLIMVELAAIEAHISGLP